MNNIRIQIIQEILKKIQFLNESGGRASFFEIAFDLPKIANSDFAGAALKAETGDLSRLIRRIPQTGDHTLTAEEKIIVKALVGREVTKISRATLLDEMSEQFFGKRFIELGDAEADAIQFSLTNPQKLKELHELSPKFEAASAAKKTIVKKSPRELAEEIVANQNFQTDVQIRLKDLILATPKNTPESTFRTKADATIIQLVKNSTTGVSDAIAQEALFLIKEQQKDAINLIIQDFLKKAREPEAWGDSAARFWNKWALGTSNQGQRFAHMGRIGWMSAVGAAFGIIGAGLQSKKSQKAQSVGNYISTGAGIASLIGGPLAISTFLASWVGATFSFADNQVPVTPPQIKCKDDEVFSTTQNKCVQTIDG